MEARLRSRSVPRAALWALVAVLAWSVVLAQEQTRHSGQVRPDASADLVFVFGKDGRGPHCPLRSWRRWYLGSTGYRRTASASSTTSPYNLQAVRDEDEEACGNQGDSTDPMESVERAIEGVVLEATTAVREGPSCTRNRDRNTPFAGGRRCEVHATAGSARPSCDGTGCLCRSGSRWWGLGCTHEQFCLGSPRSQTSCGRPMPWLKWRCKGKAVYARPKDSVDSG